MRRRDDRDRDRDSSHNSKQEIIIGGRYRLGTKLGVGAFGEVWSGTDVKSKKKVAIKLEPLNSRRPQLRYEYKLLKHLNVSGREYMEKIDRGGASWVPKIAAVPKVYWFGEEGEYKVMVQELLGRSLEDLFNYCGRKFSVKTVLLIAEQMITRLEYVHMRHFLHRDIKPDNFLIGVGEASKFVYVIDFGLSKRFKQSNGEHIPYVEGKSLTGTPRYVSLNVHLGIEQSRRDDLESLGFIWIYFLLGRLPWQGLKATNKTEKYDRIRDTKMSTPIESLCKGIPSEFGTYLHYIRSISYSDKPDYDYCRRIFRELYEKKGFAKDFQYDWVVLDQKKQRKRESKSDSTKNGDEVEREPTPLGRHRGSRPSRTDKRRATAPPRERGRRALNAVPTRRPERRDHRQAYYARLNPGLNIERAARQRQTGAHPRRRTARSGERMEDPSMQRAATAPRPASGRSGTTMQRSGSIQRSGSGISRERTGTTRDRNGSGTRDSYNTSSWPYHSQTRRSGTRRSTPDDNLSSRFERMDLKDRSSGRRR